jgi:uncharacterized membrane protein SpoIIM required for sporulation
MDLSTFLHKRRPDWRRLEEIVERVENSGPMTLSDDEAVTFGRLYRRAASDLNQAQTFVSGEATVRFLNDLVARAYLAIYGKDPVRPWAAIVWLIRVYPAVFRRNLRPLALATLLCLAGLAFGYLASRFDAATARAHLLPSQMAMIQPRGEGEDDPTPLQSTGEFAAFSSFLFTNNLQVSLVAFALGIVLGVGTVWLMFSNGVLLGAIGALFIEAGQLRTFATSVLPHGVLELPAILIAGGAGLVLAQGVLRARPWPRSEELARAGKEALLLVAGCVPLLLAAAILEAYVARAPDWFLSAGVKLGVAGVVGLLFAAYTCLGGRDNGAARAFHVSRGGGETTS